MSRKYVRGTNEERFWAYVDKSAGPDACWPWTGSKARYGYGTFNIRDRDRVGIRAHRFALELALGRRVGDGMYACHTCDNPPCCNPAHLFEGTPSQNNYDMVSKRRGQFAKTCGRGHPWTSETTRLTTSRRDGTTRVCRTCERDKRDAYNARKRAKYASRREFEQKRLRDYYWSRKAKA